MSDYLQAISVSQYVPYSNMFSSALFGGYTAMLSGAQQFEYSS